MPDWVQCLQAAMALDTRGLVGRASAAVNLQPSPPGSSRNKSRPSPGACSWCRVVCRMCGNMPLREFADGWRSSYEPPVCGYRHYRWIIWKRGNHRLAPFLAVVAFLFLFGLPTGIVLRLILPIVVIVIVVRL